MKRMHLVMALLILAGFSLGTTVITQQATGDARAAFQLSALYEQARYEIGLEQSLERTYRLDPVPS